MNKVLINVISIFLFFPAFSQKPPIDTSTFKKWASVGGGIISNDGNFVCYHIYNQPVGTDRMIVQSTNSSWNREFLNASDAQFSGYSKTILFRTGKDSLCLFSLMNSDLIYISQISEHRIVKSVQSDWLIYRVKDNMDLTLRNLNTDTELYFSAVNGYQFSDDAKCLLLETKNENNGGMVLQWLDLSKNKMIKILSFPKNEGLPGNYSFDKESEQMSFIVETKTDSLSKYTLWYYKSEMDSAKIIVSNQSAGIEPGLSLANTRPEFSPDGKRIFFGLQKARLTMPNPNAVQVDVWSYLDVELQSSQLLELKKRNEIYSAVIEIDNRKISRLTGEDETVISRNNNDFVVVEQKKVDYLGSFETYWNPKVRPSYFIVSVKDGSRRLWENRSLFMPKFSPDGKWIIYYDAKQRNYFSYEIVAGVTRNITRGTNTIWEDLENERPEYKLCGSEIWLRTDEILIYDNYDIWRLDPEANRLPENLTRAYGHKHHIRFGFTEEEPVLRNLFSKNGSVVILTAFDLTNKNRGFYHIKAGLSAEPEILSMGPFIFNDWVDSGPYGLPQKARDSNNYLITRMSAEEAPNYFLTNNFREFTRLTNVKPQENYNWLTTALYHWKTFDGGMSTGILYRPENFDPAKKYPVIFNYYEKRSDELNLFIQPQPSENNINIPWFVSRGYVVFVPDIHYKKGSPGKDAFNSVVSAALDLSKKPWIDGKRMGIEGHSFGGYETDYIIAHTNLFAAACSASGFSDLISWYGTDARGAYPMFWAEQGQGRMYCTPWQNQNAYINSSPIFSADKISTPLLMMNNKHDGTVPFINGVQFFTALRRLRKKVWMLQYDDGYHSLDFRSNSSIDFTIRMTQFFDHYLKEAPPPYWMSRGIPAKLKGIEDGLELDK